MWGNYGRILSEYPYISNFRKGDLDKYIKIENVERLEEVKKGKPVVFVSAHFSNFELMAMAIERAGINLSAIYRPLNNKMVNSIMEPLRRKYICKKQIKKGLNGVREALKYFKQGISIAIMIDQRVSEGERINFFNYPAHTTTIPAQFVKKFGCKIQPGDHVICAVSKQKIYLQNLNYWNVELQEAYFSYKEAQLKREEKKND